MKKAMKNILVVGAGYVGMANAVMFSKFHHTKILELDMGKVALINNKQSPIVDKEISDELQQELFLTATNNVELAYMAEPDFVVVCTPTDYDPETDAFNTSSVEAVIADAIKHSDATIIIKSTIPVGFVDEMREKYDYENIIFSPEFLREGTALRDCLRPKRIVMGSKSDKSEEYADLVLECVIPDFPMPPVIYTDTKEAEATKLFANGYLAMRVAFFNELDMFAERYGLSPRDIIEGIGYDERIGRHYNNPSFGYGGYCFPKDTKQLKALYKKAKIKNSLIDGVVESNDLRMDWITRRVLFSRPKTVGIYKLAMKSGSDNYRSSAIQGVIERLKKSTNVIIYDESLWDEDELWGCDVIHELNNFKRESDIIVTNRKDKDLLDVLDKVYTRDVFNNN